MLLCVYVCMCGVCRSKTAADDATELVNDNTEVGGEARAIEETAN